MFKKMLVVVRLSAILSCGMHKDTGEQCEAEMLNNNNLHYLVQQALEEASVSEQRVNKIIQASLEVHNKVLEAGAKADKCIEAAHKESAQFQEWIRERQREWDELDAQSAQIGAMLQQCQLSHEN